MMLSKKTKIAIITFIALGITGVAIIEVKKMLDKRRKKRKSPVKKRIVKNQAMLQMLKVPDEIS